MPKTNTRTEGEYARLAPSEEALAQGGCAGPATGALDDEKKASDPKARIRRSDDSRSTTQAAKKAPANRSLRQTEPTSSLLGGLYFTPDARTLVHGGSEDQRLSLWDLRSGERTIGLERSAPIVCSALSPEGHLLCAAAKDGLAMYKFNPGSASKPASCSSDPL